MGIAKLEIDLKAVQHNYHYYKSLTLSTTKIMVVSKASSYGNGELEIIKLLERNKVDYLAVALTEEGVFFREHNVTAKILVFLTDEQDFTHTVDFQLEPSIYSPEILSAFLQFLDEKKISNYPIHIKIDSGMNRLGFKKDSISHVLDLVNDPRVKVVSIFSHLLASEEKSMDDVTRQQLSYFNTVKEKFTKQFKHSILFHILNTRGITRFPNSHHDMVRLGIGLYGYSGLAQDELKSVSQLTADVLQVKKVKKGAFVGYGGENKQEEDCTIAILSIGYADGLNRTMGNGNGKVYINNVLCPFIGNICMDISMVDVSNADCQRGDIAEIFGKNISIEQVAKTMNTIPYEVFTSISKRVKRVFIQE